MADNSNSNIPEAEELLDNLQHIDAYKMLLKHKLEFSSYDNSTKTLELVSSS